MPDGNFKWFVRSFLEGKEFREFYRVEKIFTVLLLLEGRKNGYSGSGFFLYYSEADATRSEVLLGDKSLFKKLPEQVSEALRADLEALHDNRIRHTASNGIHRVLSAYIPAGDCVRHGVFLVGIIAYPRPKAKGSGDRFSVGAEAGERCVSLRRAFHDEWRAGRLPAIRATGFLG